MMRVASVIVVVISVLAIPARATAQAEQDEVFYYHLDAVGSVRAITDANGQVVERRDYLPFGEPWPVSAGSDDPRQFTGQERDSATGFDYLGARYYQSQLGRFTRADDPGFSDPGDPQTLGLYVYAYNNPLRYNDPTGHDGDCPQEWDPKTGKCVPDSRTNLWFWENLTRIGRDAQHFLQPVVDFALATRDHGCMGMMTTSGAAVGAVTGGSIGIVTGPGEAVLVPVGALTGAVRGVAIGSVVCMTSAGSGGGGSGRGGGNTDHGTGRLSQRGFSETEIADTKTGRTLKQADGANVYLKQVGAGRFNVIVEGEHGIITAMKNLTRRDLANLARNYGWNWP